jgi:hypothetical protein
MNQMGGAPPSGEITSPSDLMMAPEQPQQGRMNPGGMDALKKAVGYLLQMGMSAEELLQNLLKMAELGEMGVDEDKLRQMIESVTQGVEGQMPSEAEAAMGVEQAQVPPGIKGAGGAATEAFRNLQ